MKRRFLSIVLAICMVLTLVPSAAFAAADTNSTPSVSTYATKTQLMDGTFAPNSNGSASNIGKLAFGKNSSGDPQEWYILGEDVGVADLNTILFAASPIATGQMFEDDDENEKTDPELWDDCYYNGANISAVSPSHYGASDLRAKLKAIAANTAYFTETEKSLMNTTTVATSDAMNKDSSSNNLTYTTTDKLYALTADDYGSSVHTIKAGSSNQITLADNSYGISDDYLFWLRSPCYDAQQEGVSHFYVLNAGCGPGVGSCDVNDTSNHIRPAANINLRNVLFASSAIAAPLDSGNSDELLPRVCGIINKEPNAEPQAMTLRMGSYGKSVGTATYDLLTSKITAHRDVNATGYVSLVIQGNDGTYDWFYSEIITGTETIDASTIQSALGLSAAIDLSACKIWMETTEDNVAYAVPATEAVNTTYVTKEQLMNSFSPNSDGTANNIGKLVVGKNSSRQVQEWYILGKDSGVAGENTILFAASPIVTRQSFEGFATDLPNNGSALKKTDTNLWSDCSYSVTTPTEVYFNHYGASALRDKLQAIATESYFTAAEQGMMNATTVTTADTGNNNKAYTTTDKLYALSGSKNETKIYAGSDDQIVLAMDSYWNIGNIAFWLRSPGYNISDPAFHDSCFALNATPGSGVSYNYTPTTLAVQPAANLNLSSVVFASAAQAASYSTQELHDTIASDTAMTLRLDGRTRNIGSVNYNAAEGTIEINRGYTSMPVALMVQGNDGGNNWYYSKYIAYGYDKANLVNAADIKAALNLTSDIDLSSCKVWLESYSNPRDRGDGMIYAISAGDTPINTDTYTPPAQSVVVQDDENSTTNANLSNKILISDRMATLTVEPSVAETILSKAVENKSKKIVIDALSKNKTEAASTVVAQVDVPTTFLKALAATTEADVNFKTNVAEVTMDNAAAGAVAEQAAGDTVQLIVEKVDETADKVEFQLKVVCSKGNEIHDFNGGKAAVTVSIPESMAEKEIVCVYIDDNGRMSKVTVQKNENGTYTFFTGHFSTYALLTAEKADAAIAAQNDAIRNINITLRSKQVKMKNGKKAIKLTWTTGSDVDFDGVEIYRSAKRYSGYSKKPFYTTTKDAYYNTAIKKGTKYYYRVRGFVTIDGEKVYTDYSTKAWRTVQ